MNTEIRELKADELDGVSGGLFSLGCGSIRVALAAQVSGGGQGDPGHQGGQNDPAQMFQQILQQLTQG